MRTLRVFRFFHEYRFITVRRRHNARKKRRTVIGEFKNSRLSKNLVSRQTLPGAYLWRSEKCRPRLGPTVSRPRDRVVGISRPTKCTISKYPGRFSSRARIERVLTLLYWVLVVGIALYWD